MMKFLCRLFGHKDDTGHILGLQLKTGKVVVAHCCKRCHKWYNKFQQDEAKT